jgi:pimeloyl-ACP methyl ester carboxylesterase
MDRHLQDSFERQFEDSQTLLVHGERVRFVDIAPEKQRSTAPLFVAPGWTETPLTLKDALRTFSESGRRVLSIEHGGFVSRFSVDYGKALISKTERETLKRCGITHIHRLPLVELLKAKAIIAVLEKESIYSTDAIAHSEGAVNITIAAALHPERFRNIVLVGPAGLTDSGAESVMRRVEGFFRTMLQDVAHFLLDKTERWPLLRAFFESVRSMLRAPIASAKEVGAIVHFNMLDILPRLKKRGLSVSVVHGTNEKMFPLEHMQQLSREKSIFGFFPIIGDYHHDMYFNKEALFIESILKEMEEAGELPRG